ncbi:MAG: MarR family transcriptional regulator [Candidatus Infernicultor aquiphilus]|nr:MAG: MarR family transcriptional regulator [Candidatus Atribacteria bacterium CG17_big_fil_post_rev_8_21_14_2_50_34_11]
MKVYRKLYSVFDGFMQIKTECRFCVIDKYNISQLTLKQIEYLKKFDEYEYVTISKLAENLKLSKPSITEMVKKFIKLDCVKKEQCSHDARVYYLFLTEKGKRIARLEQMANEDFIRRVENCLSEEDISLLIELLSKVV